MQEIQIHTNQSTTQDTCIKINSTCPTQMQEIQIQFKIRVTMLIEGPVCLWSIWSHPSHSNASLENTRILNPNSVVPIELLIDIHNHIKY